MTENRLTPEELDEIDRVAERFGIEAIEGPPYTFALTTKDRGTLIAIHHVQTAAKEQIQFAGWTMGFLFGAGLLMNLTRRAEAAGHEETITEIRRLFSGDTGIVLVGSEPCRVEVSTGRLQQLVNEQAAAEGTNRSAIAAKAVTTSLALHAARFTNSRSVN